MAEIKITNEMREQIYDLNRHGIAQDNIARLLHLATGTVSRIWQCCNSAIKNDWEDYYENPRKYTLGDIEWACEYFGCPKPVINSPKQQEKTEPKKELEVADNTALAICAILNKLDTLTASVDRINGCIKNIQNDYVSLFKHLEDNISVNTDIISDAQKKTLDALNGIKMNTRKKGIENA